MKTNRILISLVIVALILGGCAARSSTNNGNQQDGYIGSAGAPVEAPMPAMENDLSYEEAKNTSSGWAAGGESTQMIMMSANLSIAVDDPSVTLTNVQKLARDMGGFTVSSSLYKTQTLNGSEVFEAQVTIRVPAQRLDEAMEKIKAMTGDAKKFTLNENVSGQDVTKEYTDLQSRLRNLEEADAKLSEFYENAANTEEALSIYTQKMQVTEQIEVIKGQIKYYDESSKLSAISVRLIAAEGINPLTIGGWQPLGVARDALQALISIGQFLVNALIVIIIVILPIFLVFYLPGRWIYKKIRQRWPSKAAYPYTPIPPAQPGTPPEQPR